jgi:hypothetical protein
MKSVVVVVIDASPKTVATLFADPTQSAQWMQSVERCEPVSGKPGLQGSVYRLVPKSKHDAMTFTGTIVQRLPNDVHMLLDAPDVTVDVQGSLESLPDGRTRFTSKEVFSFKGTWKRALGVFSKPGIHKTHRKQIQAFKKLAERKERERW